MSYLHHTNLILEHLANDAFLISAGRHRILLDSFFSRRVLPFSAMPADVMNDILEGNGRFSDVDLILATHCHKDHCDEDDLLKCRIDATIIIPEDAFTDYTQRPVQTMISISDPGVVWEDDEIKITAIKTVHDESNFAALRLHFSYLLELKPQDKCLLIMGDAQTQPGMFSKWIQGRKVTAVIINFVEPYQEKGRAFLRDLDPGLAVLCHLPLPEDDKTHMGKLSIRNTERHRAELPPVITCYEPGTTIEL